MTEEQHKSLIQIITKQLVPAVQNILKSGLWEKKFIFHIDDTQMISIGRDQIIIQKNYETKIDTDTYYNQNFREIHIEYFDFWSFDDMNNYVIYDKNFIESFSYNLMIYLKQFEEHNKKIKQIMDFAEGLGSVEKRFVILEKYYDQAG
jgi:hypothetical protein